MCLLRRIIKAIRREIRGEKPPVEIVVVSPDIKPLEVVKDVPVEVVKIPGKPYEEYAGEPEGEQSTYVVPYQETALDVDDDECTDVALPNACEKFLQFNRSDLTTIRSWAKGVAYDFAMSPGEPPYDLRPVLQVTFQGNHKVMANYDEAVENDKVVEFLRDVVDFCTYILKETEKKKSHPLTLSKSAITKGQLMKQWDSKMGKDYSPGGGYK
jgi:hypothetical protein